MCVHFGMLNFVTTGAKKVRVLHKMLHTGSTPDDVLKLVAPKQRSERNAHAVSKGRHKVNDFRDIFSWFGEERERMEESWERFGNGV